MRRGAADPTVTALLPAAAVPRRGGVRGRLRRDGDGRIDLRVALPDGDETSVADDQAGWAGLGKITAEPRG